MSNLTKLETTGIVLGALAALTSIPKFAIEVWNDNFSEPRLEVLRSAPVAFTYEPGHEVVSITVGITLHNKGKKSERIEISGGLFSVVDDPKARVGFSQKDIVVKSSPNQILRYVPIKPDSLEIITCELSAQVSEIAGLFRHQDTRRALRLAIAGDEGRSYVVVFGFDLAEGVESQLFGGDSLSPRTIRLLGSDST